MTWKLLEFEKVLITAFWGIIYLNANVWDFKVYDMRYWWDIDWQQQLICAYERQSDTSGTQTLGVDTSCSIYMTSVTLWKKYFWSRMWEQPFHQYSTENYCLAYKQYGLRTAILVQWLAELATWPVQSGAVLTGLPVRKSVLLALVLLRSKWIKQFI